MGWAELLPASELFQGKRVRAVGSNLYPRPENETFHEFLRNFAQWTFGEDWHKEQLAARPEDRHVAFRWQTTLTAQINEAASGPRRKPTATQFDTPAAGESWAFLLLGWDLVCVEHSVRIPAFLVLALRDRARFQAHRYLLSVAGVLARAGFSITFPDETPQMDLRPDLLVTRAGSSRIAVEVKSRVRQGVLDATEGGEMSDVVWLDTKIRQAKHQNPDALPFVVFLDLNTPGAADVEGIVRGIKAEREAEIHAFNAIAVTNFVSHYGPLKGATPGSWSAFYGSPRPRYPRPANGVLRAIYDELILYNAIPDEV